jgi:hypothetical protein
MAIFRDRFEFCLFVFSAAIVIYDAVLLARVLA